MLRSLFILMLVGFMVAVGFYFDRQSEVIGLYRNIDAFHGAFGNRRGDGMLLVPEDHVRLC